MFDLNLPPEDKIRLATRDIASLEDQVRQAEERLYALQDQLQEQKEINETLRQNHATSDTFAGKMYQVWLGMGLDPELFCETPEKIKEVVERVSFEDKRDAQRYRKLRARLGVYYRRNDYDNTIRPLLGVREGCTYLDIPPVGGMPYADSLDHELDKNHED